MQRCTKRCTKSFKQPPYLSGDWFSHWKNIAGSAFFFCQALWFLTFKNKKLRVPFWKAGKQATDRCCNGFRFFRASQAKNNNILLTSSLDFLLWIGALMSWRKRASLYSLFKVFMFRVRQRVHFVLHCDPDISTNTRLHIHTLSKLRSLPATSPIRDLKCPTWCLC